MSNKIVSLIFLLSSFISFAQLIPTTVGSAVDIGGNCYTITPDLTNQAGAVWYNNPIDFSNDFTIFYENTFGTKDSNGADGMALVFKRDANAIIGGNGGGLGYGGIANSLIVEFDTYTNSADNFDISQDHIGIQKNGDPNHNSINNLAGPIQASVTSPNIEDGVFHTVKIEWIAATTTLNVYFDCVLRLTLVDDVKNSIFFNDNTVFFGFVGSTGGLSNLHQLCFNRISFVQNLNLQDQTICENDTVQLDATIPSGVTYSWTPTTGVSNPNIANPVFSPTSTTTYTVTIGDICSDIETEDVTITVDPLTNPTFNPVAAICAGDALSPLPTTSLNGFTGIWLPALDNTTTTTYTFIPDTGECANLTTLDIIVNSQTAPSFNTVADICAGDALSPLPTTSLNGVTGTWSPALDNTTTTTYTFTPDTGECATTTTLNIVVNQQTTPTFNTVADICAGDALSPLPTTSLNGITGSWSPALDNTTTTTYTFTPNTGECATVTTLDIIVNPIVTPSFNSVADICAGDTLTALPTTSLNGITGSWSPVLDNTMTTTYTFTPDVGQCATTTTLGIIVIPVVTPSFNPVADICAGDPLSPLPTTSLNGVNGTWLPTLDNTTTATYTFTPDSGICATTQNLTIIVTPTDLPIFDAVDPICIGDALDPLPTISLNGISGSWSPTLDNTMTTTYTFTPDAIGCTGSTTLDIVVLPLNQLVVDAQLISEPLSSDTDVIEVIITGGSGNYEYRLDNQAWQDSNIFRLPSSCSEYIIAVRDKDGCANEEATTIKTISYPRFFTPNGDGFHDFWDIECLKDQPQSFVYIFDRYGKLLKTVAIDGVGWDGTYNNNPMPASDYWFQLHYTNTNGAPAIFNGHFALKR